MRNKLFLLIQAQICLLLCIYCAFLDRSTVPLMLVRLIMSSQTLANTAVQYSGLPSHLLALINTSFPPQLNCVLFHKACSSRAITHDGDWLHSQGKRQTLILSLGQQCSKSSLETLPLWPCCSSRHLSLDNPKELPDLHSLGFLLGFPGWLFQTSLSRVQLGDIQCFGDREERDPSFCQLSVPQWDDVFLWELQKRIAVGARGRMVQPGIHHRWAGFCQEKTKAGAGGL